NIAASGQLLHPQALLLAIAQHVDNVAAIGRERGGTSVAGAGDLRDLHALKIETMLALAPGEVQRDQRNQNSSQQRYAEVKRAAAPVHRRRCSFDGLSTGSSACCCSRRSRRF